jgi:hypothetical protein
MSRKVIKTLLFLAGAVWFVSAVAFAEKAKTINIYTDSVLPSGQEQKAGKYQVDVNEASQQVTFKKGDKVVATAGCQIVEKPEKIACSEARFGEKGNKQELQEIRCGGENRSIVLTRCRVPNLHIEFASSLLYSDAAMAPGLAVQLDLPRG